MPAAGASSAAAVRETVGFYRPAQLRRASRRLCLWAGVGMPEMEYDGLGVDNGVSDVYGFERGASDNASFDMDPTGYVGLSTMDAISQGANISSDVSSTALVPSAFTTPASTSSKSKSTKKRSASDNNSSRTTSPHSDTSSETTDKVVKRQRNTEAARRYRQRKVDRVTELEEALAAMTKERDDFKLRLARSEAEVDVLRRLVGKGS